MSYIQTADQFESAGIQELSFDEIEAVEGGAIGCLIAGGALLFIAAAAYLGYQDDHNDENRKDNSKFVLTNIVWNLS